MSQSFGAKIEGEQKLVRQLLVTSEDQDSNGLCPPLPPSVHLS